jgi:tRNA-binding protein
MALVKEIIAYSDFEKIDIRAGTIVSARMNEKARMPAYVLEIDFGPILGVKRTSAQITEAYNAQELCGLQVVAIVNFPKKKIADIWSDVLVLGVVQVDKPTILLTPKSKVENGSSVL